MRASSGGHPERRVETALTALAVRVRAEFREMPGLRLTARQAARLFGLEPAVADAVLHELRRASILASSDDGMFALTSDIDSLDR